MLERRRQDSAAVDIPQRRPEEFRRVWAAHTVSQFGTQIGFLALPLVAIAELGAGPIEVAALGTLEFLPYLLIGLPVGVWVDRLRRRPVMIGADLVRAIALLSVPATWLLGGLSLAQLYVVALVTGLLSVFFDVASQSYLPSVVPASRLVGANAKLEMSNAAAKVAGPSTAGALIQVIGAPLALAADAISYLASAGLLGRIRTSEAPPSRMREHSPFWADLIEGIRFVRTDRRLLTLAASASVGNLGAGIFDAIYLLYLVSILKLEPATIGIVYGVGNAGLLLATFLVRQLSDRATRRTLLVGAAAIRAVGVALAPVAVVGATLPMLAVGRALVAGSVMTYNVQQVSLRQQITPAWLLGRINATMRFVSWGSIPIGMVLGGLTASAVGLLATLWLGTIAVALAVLPLLWHPTLPHDGYGSADHTADRAGHDAVTV